MERAQWVLHPKAAHDALLTSPSVQNPQEDERVTKHLGFPATCTSENRMQRQNRGSADQRAQQKAGRTQMGKTEQSCREKPREKLSLKQAAHCNLDQATAYICC